MTLPIESKIFSEWCWTSQLRIMWKFGFIVALTLFVSMTMCGAIVHEHRHVKNQSSKYSIEQLLSTSFPYSDPRTDHQLDMDPCKSGKINHKAITYTLGRPSFILLTFIRNKNFSAILNVKILFFSRWCRILLKFIAKWCRIVVRCNKLVITIQPFPSDII